jgi:hypothetical protein
VDECKPLLLGGFLAETLSDREMQALRSGDAAKLAEVNAYVRSVRNIMDAGVPPLP